MLKPNTMTKARKILFPTDFSEPAANAFRYALLLADQTESTVEVLHITYPQGEPLDFPAMAAQANKILTETGREQITKFVETGITQGSGPTQKCTRHSFGCGNGPAVNTICEVARRDDIDLIVIGSRG